MAELSRFFNSVEGDERTYQANDFAQFFSNFLGNGFFEGLAVSAENTMNTVVAPGSAFIEGHEYTNTSSLTLTHAGADATQDRIDRVVLRLDRDIDVRAIQAFVKQGTAGSDPEPPALTRNDTVYELSLAQVKVEAGKSFIEGSQITDERGIVELCGRVSFSNALTDQVGSVDVKSPFERAGDYIRGHSVFYVHGEDNADLLQEWLDSVGFEPSSVGRGLSQIRAYVETNAQRTDTGMQTITIFDFSQQYDYQIYAKFSRTSNSSFSTGVDWGSWHEHELILEEGENSNGKYIKYSTGKLVCELTQNLGSITENGSGSFNDPYRTSTFQWEFPVPFSEAPNVFMGVTVDSPNSGERRASINGRTPSTTSISSIQAVRFGGSSENLNAVANLKAEGRWK